MDTDTLTAPVEFDGQKYGQATPEQLRKALEHGRALVTMRSHTTGQHVTVLFVGRKRNDDGKGWVARTKAEGRVGLGTGADCIEARDVLRDYPANYVGRFYSDKAEWRAGSDADGIRVYAAEKLLAYALDGVPLLSDVFLARQCGVCGHGLHDPESVERGVGPECFGKATGSKVAH